jgi:hypothetical protein
LLSITCVCIITRMPVCGNVRSRLILLREVQRMAKKSSSESDDTSDANRVRTSFYIDKPVLAALQARNKRTGIPMAHMIRAALDQYISREINKAVGAEVKPVGTVEELKGR